MSDESTTAPFRKIIDTTVSSPIPPEWWSNAKPAQEGPKHVTEQKSPEQCAEFRAIIEKMYSIHLDKNADYSKYNMLATGEIGGVTRLWDKMARIMSLTGFDIGTGRLEAPKEPKNESFEDTLLDMANYAIILLIMRRGKWGK